MLLNETIKEKREADASAIEASGRYPGGYRKRIIDGSIASTKG